MKTIATIFAVCLLLAAAAPGSPAQGMRLLSTEYQVTWDANGHSTPVLGHDSISDYIVYTQYSIVNGAPGNSSIYYQRVASGQPTGSPVPVANSGENQYLNDASGDYIVYTLAPSAGMAGDIILFQISTGLSRPLTSTGDCSWPRIYGNYVIWLETLVAGTQILLYDVTSVGPVQTTLIAGPTPSVGDAAIGDRFIVWSQLVNGQNDVAAYDMVKGLSVPVAANPQLNEQHVATQGAWITFETSSVSNPTGISIEAINMDTGVTLTIADNGLINQRPNISGDLLSYESNVLGYFQIFIYRLAEGDTFQVTASTYDEHLNNIHGNLVTYVDDRTGNYNVFASSLGFVFNGPAVTAASPVDFGKVNVGTSGTQNVTLKINTPLTISSIASSGDFSVGTNSCVTTFVNPTTCTLPITFTPTKPGQRWFPLVVTDSAANRYSFGLEGVGVGSALAFTPGIITTVAGNGSPGYNGDGGAATSANLWEPASVAVDGAGNLCIADKANNRIRKVDASGNIVTVAGGAGAGYNGDNIAATSAELDQPFDVAVDGAGNLYIADYSNQRIRKVNPGGIITTVAGTGTASYNGDNISAASASLWGPHGVALDSAGNLYIADSLNHRVRKVDANGIITTVAGNGTPCSGANAACGDGGLAIHAQLDSPRYLALDTAGILYIRNNDRIRKVDTSGIISTIAGNAGLGGPAVDSAGNLYLIDEGNTRILKMDPSGVMTTVAGNGTAGSSGDGGAATSAELQGPGKVTVDSAGNLYIADFWGNRIRQVNVSSSILSFGTVAAGGTSPEQIVSVSDVGNAPLNFTGFTVSTNFQTDNTASYTYCTTTTAVSPGTTCALGVDFIPTAPGNPLTGTLLVADDVFGASPQTVQLSGVSPATPVISWTAPAPITYGTALSSTQLNAAATYNGASVPGTFAYSPAIGAVLNAGPQTLSVVFTPSDTTAYATASASVTMTVNRATPLVTWSTPSAITYGTALNATQLNATANVPGTFAYNPAAGTVLGAGIKTLSVTFTPNDTTDETTATTTVTLTVSPALLTVMANNASRPYGAINPSIIPTITGVVNGDVVTAANTISAGPASPVGNYAIVPSVSGAPNVLSNYTISLVNGTLTVLQEPTVLAVTFSPASIMVGQSTTATITLTAPDMVIPIDPSVLAPFTLTSPVGSDILSNGGICIPVPSTTPGVASCTVEVTSVEPNGRTLLASFAGGADLVASTSTSTNTGELIVTAALVSQPVCIASDFRNVAVAGGNAIWFNSIFRVRDVTKQLVHVSFFKSSVQFQYKDPAGNAVSVNLAMPDADITIDPNATFASTVFDPVNNVWVTKLPWDTDDNAFLTGVPWAVPSPGMPPDVEPVTVCGTFASNVANIDIGWRWAAAAYAAFGSDATTLGVKPQDTDRDNSGTNRDLAGTPENYKQYMIPGARGKGGKNYTGSYSRSAIIE